MTGTFELPIGNNQRLGRVAQATASARESDIRLADLGRTIQNNVPKLAEEVRRARAEWEQRQESVIQWEATWDVAQRLRAASDMTLIDTLLTEQQLTQARVQLVQAKGDYASALARFRRETGTIVDYTDWSRNRSPTSQAILQTAGRQDGNVSEGLFRKASIDKVSSPEQLDLLMRSPLRSAGSRC